MLKIALTHDVDRIRKTYQYLTRSFRYLRKWDFKNIYKEFLSIPKFDDVYWNFEDIMEIEDSLNIRSTFFFLNESIPIDILHPSNWKLSFGRYMITEKKVRDIIYTLDKNGWEIGLHSSYNSYSEPKLIKEEKILLEYISGCNILGVRQHYLNLNDKTWDIQKKAGFKYDSSFGYTKKIGYKDEKISPFRPFNDDFIVFPLCIMDSCFMDDNNRNTEIRDIIEKTEIKDAILVLNWHSNNFSERDYPYYKSTYINLINLFKSNGAIFKTLGEYWRDLNIKE
ncbi:MAG TPA: polysaccharide deacetylase family protein [Candidatus Cloacimonas sp.]|nr:polysaccharide deacetylase family protein [Candidatus Cloacimonas sp.]